MVRRLKEVRSHKFGAWNQRSWAGQRYAYFWVDGMHFNAQREDAENRRPCILMVMTMCSGSPQTPRRIGDR